MVTRREVPTPTVDLRAALAATDRESSREYYAALGLPAPRGLAEQLDDGEPVEVAGWQIRRWFDPAPFEMYDRLRIEADGTVWVVRPAP